MASLEELKTKKNDLEARIAAATGSKKKAVVSGIDAASKAKADAESERDSALELAEWALGEVESLVKTIEDLEAKTTEATLS